MRWTRKLQRKTSVTIPVRSPHLALSMNQRNKPTTYPKTGYAWYVVLVLMLAYVVSYVDRSILTLLVDPIKADMGFSDLQISVLHGFAFALFYSFMGFPIGRIADSRSRVGIIAIGIAVWSVMTAACGLAKNFLHFFLARVGVGFGEAALNPAAYSIITDYFPPDKLSRAISTYVMGTYMGFGLSYIIGASVLSAIDSMPGISISVPFFGDIYSWQLAFFIVALPGVFLIPILRTIREPFRRGRLHKETEKIKTIPFSEFHAFVIENRKTFLCHATGYGCLGIVANGMALWTPTFMKRTYGWELIEAGMVYGVLLLVLGGGGVYFGGWLADFIQARGYRTAALNTAVLCAAIAVVPATIYPLMPTPELALAVMAPMIFFSSAPWGVAVSAIQQFTPNELRGQISALMYLFPVNLIGIGLGPSLVAFITDYGFGDTDALRYSMAIVAGVAALLAALILSAGIKPFRDSLQQAERWL